MTPGEERQLYETDRAAWIKYVAPKLAKQIETMTDEQINQTWSLTPADYKSAVWALLSGEQQARVRTIRARRQSTASNAKPTRINRKPAHRKMTDAQLACLQGDV